MHLGDAGKKACEKCGIYRTSRSDNLKRHEKKCNGAVAPAPAVPPALPALPAPPTATAAAAPTAPAVVDVPVGSVELGPLAYAEVLAQWLRTQPQSLVQDLQAQWRSRWAQELLALSPPAQQQHWAPEEPAAPQLPQERYTPVDLHQGEEPEATGQSWTPPVDWDFWLDRNALPQ